MAAAEKITTVVPTMRCRAVSARSATLFPPAPGGLVQVAFAGAQLLPSLLGLRVLSNSSVASEIHVAASFRSKGSAEAVEDFLEAATIEMAAGGMEGWDPETRGWGLDWGSG